VTKDQGKKEELFNDKMLQIQKQEDAIQKMVKTVLLRVFA
jgi:hypothetical protein